MKLGVHEAITREALRDQFTPDVLRFVVRSNLRSDDLHNQDFSAQHFDNCELDKGVTLIGELKRLAVSELTGVSNSSASLSAAGVSEKEGRLIFGLYAFGRLLHAIQDFYSHSNWINLTGPSSDLWPETPAGENLKSGYFKGLEDVVEAVAPSLSDRLRPIYLLDPCLKEVRHEKWVPRGDRDVRTTTYDRVRLSWAECRAERSNFYEGYLRRDPVMRHGELNKDENGTLADLAFSWKHGVGGHAVAVEKTKNHSRSKWMEITKALGSDVTREVRRSGLTLEIAQSSDVDPIWYFLERTLYRSINPNCF